MSEETHRFFSPSASSRWLSCTASPIVDVSRLVERVSPAAARGTMLHTEAEVCIRDNVVPRKDIDQADREAVEWCLERVRAMSWERRLLEFRSDLVDGLCGGTADVVGINAEPGVLDVWDYKFGSMRVDPAGNTQLGIYALGVARKLEPLGYDLDWVRMRILQPACDNDEVWECDLRELDKIVGDPVRDTIDRIMDGDVEFVPTESNCFFCPAKPICPALGKARLAVARDDFAIKGSEAETLELRRGLEADAERGVRDIDWGERMRLVPLLEQWCKSVKSVAAGLALSGEKINGFKVVEGRKGNRAFVESDRRALTDWLVKEGLDETKIYSDPKLLSPNQIEGKLKELAGDDKVRLTELKENLKKFWEEGAPGPPTLAPEDDRREALDGAEMARRDFSEYINRPKSGGDEE